MPWLTFGRDDGGFESGTLGVGGVTFAPLPGDPRLSTERLRWECCIGSPDFGAFAPTGSRDDAGCRLEES
jgi:hypothetical protein